MAVPVNETSVIISLALVVIWAAIKFGSHKHRAHSEDVVDLIALLLLGPVMVIGAIFIGISLGVVPLTTIEGLFIHMGISGAILIGAMIYFFYITLYREDSGTQHKTVRHTMPQIALKVRPKSRKRRKR